MDVLHISWWPLAQCELCTTSMSLSSSTKFIFWTDTKRHIVTELCFFSNFNKIHMIKYITLTHFKCVCQWN